MSTSDRNESQALIALGALGVVFGDIGTSPLYAFSEIFFSHSMPLSREAIFGVCSLILWALILVISIKYLVLIVRASNDGEGGVFALYSLLHPHRRDHRIVEWFMVLLILSAGFLFGDGVITPAISVLSAVEGLKFSYPHLESMIVPISMGILTALFMLQSRGTHLVGHLFGPVLLVWFAMIGWFGFQQVIAYPEILEAFDPKYAIGFVLQASPKTLVIVFGGVILAITGGEALYADMGHFNIRAIRQSWFFIVFPALLLSYLGQGAFLLSGQVVDHGSIFFSMIPSAAKFPMTLLATIATVIASQALISGVFSLTTQAVALGVFPRLKIRYTHDRHIGQVYVPLVNWTLWAGCLALVFAFEKSERLASAYGLAVSADMFISTTTMVVLTLIAWRWEWYQSLAAFGLFLVFDIGFMATNSLKFFDGGYIPFGIGATLFLVMLTWRWGRKATFSAYSSVPTMKIHELIDIHRKQSGFPQRNLLLLVPKPVKSESENTPALVQMVYDRYGLLASNIFFVEIVHKKVPYLYHDRYDVKVFERNGNGMIASVAIKFGFMEEPNVERVLEGIAKHHEIQLNPDPANWVFHVSQELFRMKKKHVPWHRLRLALYSLLRQISRPGYVFYGLGDEVQLSVQIIPVKI